jgi:hypothetical protein
MFKRSTVLATSITPSHSFSRAAYSSGAFQFTSPKANGPIKMLLNESSFKHMDIFIAKTLEEYEVDHWGFMIYRCTYGSQTKWDKFMALVKEESRKAIKEHGTGDLSVFDKMAWTVIEDAETLDGASILETSNRFIMRAEIKHEEETMGIRSLTPRHNFFIHVDEESLESVVDEEKARDREGYVLLQGRIYPSSVHIREMARLTGDAPEVDDPLDEQLLDCIKMFNIHDLVPLYSYLLGNIDQWYYIHAFVGEIAMIRYVHI